MNPSGFRLQPGEEIEVQELEDGLFAVCNTHIGEYDYFKDPVLQLAVSDHSLKELEEVTSTISSQINGVYVQQFLANLYSVLESCKELAGEAGGMPELLSAYPRRLLERPLNDDELGELIENVTAETGISNDEIKEYVRRHLHEFLQTQQESMVFGYEKLDIRRVVQGMEESYKEFYDFKPLHEPDLRNIFEGEGIQVIYLERLPVLAGLITYVNKEGNRMHAAIVRNDATVPQALREFAMAHELGHWFAHIKGKQPEMIDHFDFYLHSFHDLGPFEHEANKIALLTLFPTPYLSWHDVHGNLTAENILCEFTQGLQDNLGERLKRHMLSFIERRIESYHNYRRLWLELLRLPKVSLKESVLPILIETFFSDFGWAILNTDYKIIDANDKFSRLVGLTKEELLSEEKHINELTEASARPTTLEQLEKKRKDLTPKFYITKYINMRTAEVIPVTIYAFPIVNQANAYIGSFGIVTDIREGVWKHLQ